MFGNMYILTIIIFVTSDIHWGIISFGGLNKLQD